MQGWWEKQGLGYRVCGSTLEQEIRIKDGVGTLRWGVSPTGVGLLAQVNLLLAQLLAQRSYVFPNAAISFIFLCNLI